MTILDRIVEDKKKAVLQSQALTPLAQLQERIASTPWQQRGFYQRLMTPGPGGVNIIAEVKRASPSKGDICANLPAAPCAQAYETGGAAAISVIEVIVLCCLGPFHHGSYACGAITILRREQGALQLFL